LANSEGWIVKPAGSRIHAWAPKIVLPTGDRTSGCAATASHDVAASPSAPHPEVPASVAPCSGPTAPVPTSAGHPDRPTPHRAEHLSWRIRVFGRDTAPACTGQLPTPWSRWPRRPAGEVSPALSWRSDPHGTRSRNAALTP
jgi:hypothetical protein